MKILAFDTTGSNLSVALVFDNQIIKEIDIAPSSQQAQLLIVTLEDVLKSANIWYQDLDLIAFTKGPGSFTGVRVGLAVAKTLRLLLTCPIIPLSSLEVIAYAQKDNPNIIAAIDAKMNEFFLAQFKSENQIWQRINADQLLDFNGLEEFIKNLDDKKYLLCGFASEIMAGIFSKYQKNYALPSNQNQIGAAIIAHLGYKKYQENSKTDELNALYLREAKITARKK